MSVIPCQGRGTKRNVTIVNMTHEIEIFGHMSPDAAWDVEESMESCEMSILGICFNKGPRGSSNILCLV